MKVYSPIIYIGIILFFAASALHAQDDGDTGSDNSKYEIKPYTPGGSSAAAGKPYTPSKQSSAFHNIVKFSLMGISNGNYSLLYERNLGRQFSIEVGFGITLRDDFGLFFDQLTMDEGEHRYNVGHNNAFDDNRRFKVGQSYSLYARRYFGDNYGEEMTGFYVGLGFDRRHHYSTVDENFPIWQPVQLDENMAFEREKRVVTNFTTHVGYQRSVTSFAMVDFGAALGYRTTQNQFYDLGERDPQTQNYSIELYERNFSGFTFMIISKVGLLF